MPADNFLLGVHVSISGGLYSAVEQAAALGCTTFQIFPSNPRGWRQKEHSAEDVDKFRQGVQQKDLEPFFVHMPFLPNLATPDDGLYEKSVAALAQVIEVTARLGGRYVVTHLGSHRGAGVKTGRERVAAALSAAAKETAGSDVMILMENSAGKSNQVGTTFAELTTLYKKVGKKVQTRLGLCFDTCHAHVMGYDLSAGGGGLKRILTEVDAFIGLDKIKLLHLNDAKGEAGTGLDRHEHIGYGSIGREGFAEIINHRALRKRPMVLETPREDNWDRKNLKTLRRLRT
jgi:deoxyribonuclease-4